MINADQYWSMSDQICGIVTNADQFWINNRILIRHWSVLIDIDHWNSTSWLNHDRSYQEYSWNSVKVLCELNFPTCFKRLCTGNPGRRESSPFHFFQIFHEIRWFTLLMKGLRVNNHILWKFGGNETGCFHICLDFPHTASLLFHVIWWFSFVNYCQMTWNQWECLQKNGPN